MNKVHFLGLFSKTSASLQNSEVSLTQDGLSLQYKTSTGIVRILPTSFVDEATISTIQSDLSVATTNITNLTSSLSDEVAARIAADSAINTDLTTNYLNKTTTTPQTVAGKVTFEDEVTFNGNVKFNGTIDQINKTEINVEDTAIILSKGTSTAVDVAIKVDRASDGVLEFVSWKESGNSSTVQIPVYDSGSSTFVKQDVATKEWILANYSSSAGLSDETEARITADNAIISSVNALDSRISAEETKTGSLASLTVNDKTSLVTAINEVKESVDTEVAARTQAISTLSAQVTAASNSVNTLKANTETAINSTKYKETTNAAAKLSTYVITHNLGTEDVVVNVWVKDETSGMFQNDTVSVEITDNNSITVYLAEASQIKVSVISLEDVTIS
jgi:hypothetical protein